MQPQRQREVAEIVGPELPLEALRRLFQLGHRHDAGVVDQDVERSCPVIDEGLDGAQVRKVERPHLQGGVPGGLAQLLGNRSRGVGAADGKRDLGAGKRQRPDGLKLLLLFRLLQVYSSLCLPLFLLMYADRFTP